MAITRADTEMWADLLNRDLVPARPRILEIGQANWYGDIPVPEGCHDTNSFNVARNWYKRTLDYSAITALDWHGPDALRVDLNERVDLDGVFDIVINTGTAEHVFDQRRLFQTIHEYCAVGGLMVHAAPSQGWKDHGFYNYQPGLFRDLGKANGYEGVFFRSWSFPRQELLNDVMLYVALRKVRLAPFQVPIQGKYRNER